MWIGCARAHAPTSDRATPCRTLSFHADIEFTPRERLWLAEVSFELKKQTSGILAVRIAYDVDFGDVWNVVLHAGGSVLVRASPDSRLVLDQDTVNTTLLGIVGGIDLNPFVPTDTLRVYLVADRMQYAALFRHVAMHEFLHAFGFRHVGDPRAIMASSVTWDIPPLKFTTLDFYELCRLYGCEKETSLCQP